MKRGLFSFINGTEEQPAEDATAQIKNVYQLRRDKAYSLIALSVDKKSTNPYYASVICNHAPPPPPPTPGT